LHVIKKGYIASAETATMGQQPTLGSLPFRQRLSSGETLCHLTSNCRAASLGKWLYPDAG
jgi:hypothetical protein